MARPRIKRTLCRVRPRQRASERGLTLVEMLIAVTLLSAIVLAMSGAMFTTISVSGRQQSTSNSEAAARRSAEMVRAAAYQACGTVASYNTALRAADATIGNPVTRVRWWNGATALGTATPLTWNAPPTPCVDHCMQLIDVQATVQGIVANISVVKRGDSC